MFLFCFFMGGGGVGELFVEVLTIVVWTAQLPEYWTHDQKAVNAGLISGWSGRRIFFSRVKFLC